MIEAHGGTVSAQSPGEGKGATFTVRLPITVARPVVDRDTEPPRAHRARSRYDVDGVAVPSLSGLPLLAVDDDRDSLDLIMSILTSAGAEVRVWIGTGGPENPPGLAAGRAHLRYRDAG